MPAPRIKIQGKTYKVPTLDELTLDDILLLDAELQERYSSSWAKVQQFAMETAEMSELEAALHPMATLMAGVTVWMVLRVAGKKSLTMQEALSIPPDSVQEIVMDGPKDHQPKRKSKPRKASAPAPAPGPSRQEAPAALSSLPTSSASRSESA